MSLGCFTAALSVVLYTWGRNPKLRRIGGFVLTAALLLMPMATEAAVGLLLCDSVRLKASAVAVLDGGGPAAAGRSAQELVSISVLNSDPYFVCWAGRCVRGRGCHALPTVVHASALPSCSHHAAALLAACAMAVYIFMLPLCVFVWLWRDRWLKQELARTRSPPGALPKQGDKYRPSDDARDTRIGGARVAPIDGSGSSAVNSSTAGNRETSAGKRLQDPQATGVVDKADVPFDSLLVVCFSGAGYAVHAWYFRLLDLTAVISLAALQAAVPRPVLLSTLVAKVSRNARVFSMRCSMMRRPQVFVNVAILLCLCVALLTVRPFAKGHTWKLNVRALLLILSAACASMNATASAIDLGYGTQGLATFVVIGEKRSQLIGSGQCRIFSSLISSQS